MPIDHARFRSDIGTSAVEIVALTATLATLVAGLALALPDSAPQVGAALARQTARLVAAPPRPVRQRITWAKSRQLRGRQLLRPGDLAVDSDASRAAWRSIDRETRHRSAHGSMSARMHGCVLCAGLQHNGSLNGGGGLRSDRRGAAAGDGLAADGEARLHASLAAASASASASAAAGALTARAHVGARGSIGIDAHAGGVAILGRERQELDVDAGAIAGASAGIEGRASARLAGIGVSAAAGADGWAGAGALGHVHVAHPARGRIEVGVSGGAALGLGGSARLFAAIDVSHLHLPGSRRTRQHPNPSRSRRCAHCTS